MTTAAEDALNESRALLAGVPGGSELLAWMGGLPDFHDAEVVGLRLERDGPCELSLSLDYGERSAVATFVLGHWIDVSLRGFSGQNVVGGLALRRAPPRRTDPWEMGVGVRPGSVEIVLAPCFGANGTIRAQLLGVRLVAEGAPAKR